MIAADIARGRLEPGERLSSSRTLAAELGVNRNTIVAAFEVLRVEGWIEGDSTRGVCVAQSRARTPGQAAEDADAALPGFDLPPAGPGQRPVPRRSGLLLLLGGVPDLRLLPHRELARA